ncbi:MAG TPA: four helix bundle protein, partial [Thermoanaerobaculia bacterium]
KHEETVQDFHNLKVWTKAHKLALAIYSVTRKFPKEETYGLRSQLRSSSASIGMNIAEGCGRDGDKEFARFLHFSMGSANELEYQLLLSRDLEFIQPDQFEELQNRVAEIKRMLTSLLRKLRAVS